MECHVEYCRHFGLGIHQEEKDNLQRVLINVEMCVNTGISFSEIVDYDLLIAHLRSYNGKMIMTQEYLVSEIMNFAESSFLSLKEIKVSSAKPDVFEDWGRVGVEQYKRVI